MLLILLLLWLKSLLLLVKIASATGKHLVLRCWWRLLLLCFWRWKFYLAMLVREAWWCLIFIVHSCLLILQSLLGLWNLQIIVFEPALERLTLLLNVVRSYTFIVKIRAIELVYIIDLRASMACRCQENGLLGIIDLISGRERLDILIRADRRC